MSRYTLGKVFILLKWNNLLKVNSVTMAEVRLPSPFAVHLSFPFEHSQPFHLRIAENFAFDLYKGDILSVIYHDMT